MFNDKVSWLELRAQHPKSCLGFGGNHTWFGCYRRKGRGLYGSLVRHWGEWGGNTIPNNGMTRFIIALNADVRFLAPIDTKGNPDFGFKQCVDQGPLSISLDPESEGSKGDRI